jgi:hypothetical protein
MALTSLRSSAEELKQATKYAELATSSVDGFKLILAEKIKLKNEMKKRFSVARLRWVKAINRVLVQNYCEKVRKRLSELEDQKRALFKIDTNPEAALGGSKRKPKILRKSIDNSMLAENTKGDDLHLPSIMKTVSNDGSPTHFPRHQTSTLPAVLNSPQKTVQKNVSNESRLARRSLNQDALLIKYLPDSSFRPKSTNIAQSPSNSTKVYYNSSSVPTLLQSYSHNSQKVLPPLSLANINPNFESFSFKQIKG